MFLFNRFKASKVLKNNNYVDDYDISYKFPDTIKIDITERKVRGYVPYMGFIPLHRRVWTCFGN